MSNKFYNNITAPLVFALSTAYFISGFCALVYQAVWIRMFSQVFGSTVFAMSVVVAVFFGGLALGGFLFGKISTWSDNPVRLYGFLEIIISLYVLVFPWILDQAESLYGGIYLNMPDKSFVLVTFFRVLVSFCVLIVPTVLMGGTLPILAKYFVRKLSAAGGLAGWIYGLNAVGAAAGAFLTGYILLINIGVTKTLALAGLINLIPGLVALAVSGKITLANDSKENMGQNIQNKTRNITKFSKLAKITIICFSVSGFVSMSYEVIWLRYLVFFFRDSSFLYTGIITIFVLGIGAGSLVCGRMISRIKKPVSFFGFLQAGIGIFTILAIYLPIPFFDAIYFIGDKSGGILLFILFALLIIPALFMGSTFPVVTKIITNDLSTVGDKVGKAYALNMIGSILGTLAAGFLFFPFLGLQNTLYFLFAINMVLAAALIISDRTFVHKFIWIVPVIFAVIFPAGLEYGADNKLLPEVILNKRLSGSSEILDVREGVTGTSWVSRNKELLTTLWDTSIAISRSDNASFMRQGFIPLLIAPEIPENVLGLAFGGGLSYYAARLFPEVKRLEFVDISKENMEMALKHMPENEGLKSDSRADFVIDDAYNFVKYSDKKYGLILMEPTPPSFSFRTAALYTKDFYELVQKRLSENGYFAQIVPLYNMTEAETINVMKTFSSVFDYSILWWNNADSLMIGSNKEFQIDAGKIQGRLNRPVIQESLVKYAPSPQYNFASNFISGFLLTPGDFKKVSQDGKVYTDDSPGLEFSTGQNITSANIKAIHANLSGWEEIQKNFTGNTFSNTDYQLYDLLRENLMMVTYSEYPEDFIPVFLNYINIFPDEMKIQNLHFLEKYLLEKGLVKEAGAIREKISKLSVNN